MPFAIPVTPGSSIFLIDSLPTKQFHGLTCSIETPKGHVREGRGWSCKMPADYGFINGFIGADGDEVDCYLGPNLKSKFVAIANQDVLDGEGFDEHKTLLGFNNLEEAKKCYMEGHHRSKDIFRSIIPMDIEMFKTWLKHGKKDRPVLMRTDDLCHPLNLLH